jgi:hypothetical protein
LATPEEARAVLAAWAGLRRLQMGEPDPDEERLKALVNDDGARLARLACEGILFDADAWLGRAAELDRAWDEGEEAEELDWQTHQLLEQLDHAALNLWALGRLGAPEEAGRLTTARKAVARAEGFLAARPDLFLSLASDATAVISAARPGLEDDEPELWETLLKYRRIEEARDELETPPERDALLGQAVTRGGTVQPHAADWSWLPEPPLAMAAATGRAAGMVHLQWREPGGEHSAVLAVDRSDPATPLRVNFYHGDEAASDLQDKPVWLAGCEGRIDEQGNADFPQDELRRVRGEGRPVRLEVGPAKVAWEFVEGTHN